MPPDVKSRIADVVCDRGRLLAPALFVTVLFYVLADRPLGYEAPRVPYVYSWCVLGVLAALTVGFLTRRIPERWSHVASAALLWCSASSTLLTLAATHAMGPVLLVLVQVASAGILLHTGWVIATLGAITALSFPMLLQIPGLPPAMGIAALVTAALFAVLIHLLVLGSIVRAETLQLAEAATARRLAKQLRESASLHDQLLHAQRMEAVGTLAAGIAHDMNNVLASIANLASLLRDASNREQHADLAQIVDQADRGAQLTRGLLAFSRRGQYRKEVMRFDDMIRKLLPLLPRMLPKSIEVRDAIDVGDARVDGDPVHLGQVVMNLALNAADAMNGSGVISIGATTVELNGRRYVQLCVTDTGHGMDAETRLRVFEPFFTTKPMGKGSGLGLSIVWGIVQAHDGAIEIHSELGKGSTFTVRLPVTEAQPLPEPAPASPAPVVTRNTVLVVDDEASVRETTRRLLTRLGLDVLTASNGEEALATFAQHAASIRLVVLDMGMPVMSGAQCFQKLRDHSNVPVLIATGYAVDEQVRELVAAGAEILEKPFSAADLRREVSKLLRAELRTTKVQLIDRQGCVVATRPA